MTNSTKTSKVRRAKAAVIGLASALALAGCVSPVAGPGGKYAKPIGGAPVIANPTPYTKSLVCLGQFSRQNAITPPRIAVGRILDYTGKIDEKGGRQITQGASLMAMSAFAKAGSRLVERFDTSVSELELKYSNNKLIGDEATTDFRRIQAGSIPGSDFFLVGGITELNSNIRSSGVEAFVGDTDFGDPKGGGGFRLFVINVGVDLRLVDTETLEVVDVISYQKQIIGREIQANYFDFFGGTLFDIGGGERAQEPIQLAIRATIERAVLEMTANLYGASGPDVCDQLTDETISTLGKTGDYIEAYDNTGTNNGDTRDAASRWHDRRDSRIREGLLRAQRDSLYGRRSWDSHSRRTLLRQIRTTGYRSGPAWRCMGKRKCTCALL